MSNVYVCVLEHAGIIYKFDNKYYSQAKTAKKRCDKLNEELNRKIGAYKVVQANNWHDTRY